VEVHNSWCKSQPPDDQSTSAVCLSVIQHVRAKISPMTRMPYPGVDSGNVALSAIVISSGTSQPARRRHSRAGGCGPRDESRRRESAFSRFAGVGQVGRFALDPPPISCSPPLAPATVRRSTVNTCTRSRLPTRISRQRQLILYVLLNVQAPNFANGEQFLTFLPTVKLCSRGTTRSVNQGSFNLELIISLELIIQSFCLELIIQSSNLELII